MAPVFIGIATPDFELLEAPPAELAALAATVGAAPREVAAAGTPDVSGLSEALDAPEKATGWVDAVPLGAALVLLGLRTLEQCQRWLA